MGEELLEGHREVRRRNAWAWKDTAKGSLLEKAGIQGHTWLGSIV